MQNFPAIDWTRILFWQWGIRHIGSCGAQDFLPLADRRKILDDAVRAECEDGVVPLASDPQWRREQFRCGIGCRSNLSIILQPGARHAPADTGRGDIYICCNRQQNILSVNAFLYR